MAINTLSVASWGLIGGAGGGSTQVVEGPIELTITTDDLLTVSLEADEITVEIDDE
jgi:hypothetical protein